MFDDYHYTNYKRTQKKKKKEKGKIKKNVTALPLELKND
jgi:hypothetical protein